ncbi:carboxylesterase family protein [Mycobacterium talmoniae]|uniref:Carboxylesterase type B domain-containing protein n=1 Tax=Mycobacterium talmoniae TaxID=1858794 RepID=A0A1S1N3L1_9MYCO|nr:hypothetical protein BKN37_24560 [Mycobacterium talmoniae]
MSVVQTRSGAVRGVEVDGVWAWRGIPYAAPPVGELRWAAPRREPPWSGVRDGAGAVAQAYAERYPQLSPTQRRHVFMTDERYGAPTLRLLDGQSQHAPVWSFRFKAPSEGQPAPTCRTGSGWPAAPTRDRRAVRGHPAGPGQLPAHRGAVLAAAARAISASTAPPCCWRCPSRVVIDGANPLYPSVWAGHDWAPGTWWPLLEPGGG